MEIDIWEVVDAAATKPFGFAAFQPGPGLGGRIPIDPFYLTWKAREYDFSTRFIELAGEVNQNMPYYCRSRVSQALNHGAEVARGLRVLVLGVAYKADISDWRESPAVKLIELLRNAGANVAYHDPHVASFATDGIASQSVPLAPADYDLVVIATAHSASTTRSSSRTRSSSSTCATRPGAPASRATRSGSFDPRRPRGRRRLGRTSSGSSRRGPRLDLRHRRGAAGRVRARYPQAHDGVVR